MAFLRAVTHVEAPPRRVWPLLADWERESEWMVDATTIEVVGERREGSGTRIRAITTIAGVPLPDEMIVERWEPERLILMRHVGRPIRGVAWFALAPTDHGTRFEWAEEIDPPFVPLGELGAAVLRDGLEGMLRRSVAKLKRLAEATGS